MSEPHRNPMAPHQGLSEAEPLDMLVVGAGPCGTAAAFRATELGRSVLVIDRDQVLSILREWTESNKKVDANYDECEGPFAGGGELMSQIPYEDQTWAKDLYDKWIQVYDAHGIPYREQSELVTVERVGDLLAASFQSDGGMQRVFCRHVVLAIGKGQNPKLDLMGDTKGVKYRLRKPDEFVGKPACVIGGGMSAAEAVVAISDAKSDAEDSTAVYWVNRRQNLPRVAMGIALANRFFTAWTRGNIQYLPLSKPLAVIRDDEEQERFAVRVRRRNVSGEPPETVVFEFEKSQVLACIGADRPDEFLASLGIQLFEAADSPKPKRVAVSTILESQQQGVFLAGSILDKSYIETADFPGDVLDRPVREHPGCFKTAIADGVLVAESIDGLMRGESAERIASSAAVLRADLGPTQARERPAEPMEAAPAEVYEPALGAKFLHIGPDPSAPDQVLRTERVFAPGTLTIGRRTGDLTFPNDEFMADPHGLIRIDYEDCQASDSGARGYTYVRLSAERTLSVGTYLSAGNQRLLVDQHEGALVIARLDGQGNVLARLPVPDHEVTYGRAELDPNDGFLSKQHFDAQAVGGVVRLRDCSRNGTYVEVHGSLRLNEGDEVCMGDQRFRFLGMVGIEAEEVVAAPAAGVAAGAVGVAEPALAAADAGPAVVDAPQPADVGAAPGGPPQLVLEDGRTFDLAEGQSLLHKLYEEGLASDDEDEGAAVLFSCWDPDSADDVDGNGGTCGYCVVAIADGEAGIAAPASSKEQKTLTKKSAGSRPDLDLSRCRLACKCVVAAGAVKIETFGAP